MVLWVKLRAATPGPPTNRMSPTVTRVPPAAGSNVQNGKARPHQERADVRCVACDRHSRISVVLRHRARIEPHVSRLPREGARLVTVACIDDDLPAQRRNRHGPDHQRLRWRSFGLVASDRRFRRVPRVPTRSWRTHTPSQAPASRAPAPTERRRRASQTPAPRTIHSQGSMMNRTSP